MKYLNRDVWGVKKKLGEKNKERFKTCYLMKQATYLQNVLFTILYTQ